MLDDSDNEVLQLSPSTPHAIHELKNYQPFSCERSFSHSLRVARDTFKHENRAIGVFTSGDDAPGTHAEQSSATFETVILRAVFQDCIRSLCPRQNRVIIFS